MPTRTAEKRKKQKGSGGFIFGTLSFLIICAAIIMAICVFFRVSRIEVTGTDRYTQEDIIAQSGIKTGASLLTLNCASVSAKLETMDYVGRAEVTRKMPDTVEIVIHESDKVACVSTDKGYWLIDDYCRLIEAVNGQDINNFVVVTGVTANGPAKSKEMSTSEEDQSKVSYLADILTALDEADMLGDVKSIDVSNTANAQFEYMGRFTVKLGRDENTARKLSLLKNSITELNDTDTGTFDLSEDKKATFSPS